MIQILMPYALIALALIGSLGLFLSLKGELWTSARKQRRRVAQITQRLDEAWTSSQQPAIPLLAAPQATRSSLNYNRRAQALRLARRGDDPSRIAAVLGMTRKEVELLLRVQTITIAKASGSN
ncbi:MAG: hypothetical protein ABSB35_03090 [Bryobacteraceae bacterium]|jgi:hypothetical protein